MIKRKRRTRNDFSTHELIVKTSEDLKIWSLKIPGTITYKVSFINVDGVMVVNGDFGRFVFCREFHPTAGGYVSDAYWCEKLKSESCQNPYKFDHEETEKKIQDLRDLHFEEIEKYSEIADYLDSCDDANHSAEWEYDSVAYGDKPDKMDWEEVPKGFSLVNYLPQVFDAFDEICDRLSTDKKDE